MFNEINGGKGPTTYSFDGFIKLIESFVTEQSTEFQIQRLERLLLTGDVEAIGAVVDGDRGYFFLTEGRKQVTILFKNQHMWPLLILKPDLQILGYGALISKRALLHHENWSFFANLGLRSLLIKEFEQLFHPDVAQNINQRRGSQFLLTFPSKIIIEYYFQFFPKTNELPLLRANNSIIKKVKLNWPEIKSMLIKFVPNYINNTQITMEQVKPIKAHYLYNMLQDFRHIVVFDLRKQAEFEESQIRDSFCFADNVTKQKVQDLILYAIKKAEEKQKKYPQLKVIRRYFFIDHEGKDLKTLDQKANGKIQLVLSLAPKDPNNKFYYVTGGYKEYFETYPYTCLVRSGLQKLKSQNASQEQQQKWLLYPYCRFPTEIIPGKLYLGNIFSSNSERQLKDLKIKSLVDFVEYKDEENGEQSANRIPQFKKDENKYNFFHLPFNKDVHVNINFDEINQEIEKRVNEGPTLLYCLDGQTISAAFTIAYLMYKANLDISMATLKVCQAISRTDITKWIYTQLLVYKPQKPK